MRWAASCGKHDSSKKRNEGRSAAKGRTRQGVVGGLGFQCQQGKGKESPGQRGERAKGKGTAQRVLGDDVEQKINQFLLWDLSDVCE